VRSAPATRNFTDVSSPWITRDSNTRWCICRYSGSSRAAQAASQSPSVDRATTTPLRDSCPANRCSGVWSANLAVTTWASSPGPHSPLASGPT
jgi:hypothetical protein